MRVLFVDDEVQVLRGITRMLELDGEAWDVETATGGEQALQILAESPFDVVVTDMCMPGMDGASLLKKMSDDYPGVVRIVLSGQAEKGAVLRAVKSMHQYLSKPCDHAALKSTIARACGLRELLVQPELRDMLGRIQNLPSVPALYRDLEAAIESPDATAKTLGKIIVKDPAISAKLMQLANSAAFGMKSRISTPDQAVSMLGFDLIRALVLSSSVLQACGSRADWFSPERLFDHSMNVGCAARRIALRERAEKSVADEAFSAGLMHDVGKLVLFHTLPDQFREALELAQRESIPLHQAEHKILGCSHATIGAYLLQLWGLPQSIIEAVAFHHSIEMHTISQMNTPMTMVFAANWFVGRNEPSALSEQLHSILGDNQAKEVVGKFMQWQEYCNNPEGEVE